LPGDVILGIRYVGSRGEKLFANQQYNYFNGLTGARLNTSRGAIILRQNGADSDYNGLEVSGTYNLRHGLQVRGDYVYSKDLDDGSEIFTLGTDTTSYAANLAPGGRSQDWGPSAYDHRNFFSIAYLYTVPGLRSSNQLTDLFENVFTRNWTLSGVTRLQSGSWATYEVNGDDINGDSSTSNDRPVVVNPAAPLQSVGIDGHFIKGTAGTYYDLAAYNNTPAGAPPVLNPVSASSVHFLIPYEPDNSYLHQEIGRNSFELPGTTTWNFALEKGIDVKERARFILRAEAQDVFNHNDRTVSNTNVVNAGGAFLSPSRLSAARSVVLWGKFEF